ncbi:DUF1496 domain-containing protein [Pseudoalteromonas sp. KS88]|uniref:DUF1496 domain-containing protein n=1 Tax=Pseudoalteromonas sp. KS88 TaxID=2109918 RepID=UPI0010816D8F|nr:DUF1496 domain-containing protein [Pseudoalteromonas sp. KS88]TGE85258.1 DUF1496 domain-containing protein [Pseudoalteromonas sp. KS88]
MRILTTIGLCFVCFIYSVNSFGDNLKTTLLLNPQDVINQQSVCWFDDKRYSEGAVVIMANLKVICTAKKPQHNNSSLMWLMLSDENEIIYPKAPKTIRVN